MEDKYDRKMNTKMEFKSIDMKATGQRIRDLMKQKNLSVKQLSEQMEVVSPQAIYKWFRGENIPSIENLFLLKDILGTEGIEELIVFNAHEDIDARDN